jgi:alkanesulfonate monooxygenase SsuD/methylene tetrahydromethanopterin reductase-like flavin-dependent oxidoreductase (luciferase family)
LDGVGTVLARDQQPHPPIVIGGTGKKRTLRAVARWAQMWDAQMVEPEEWLELREILEGHCQDVGRDPGEIDCSAHVRYSKGDDVSKLADEAARRFEVGVDVVIFTMGSPNDVSMIAPLADALATVS